MSALKGVEKKLYGAFIVLSDKDMNVEASMKQIASVMGYKKTGGAISFALQALNMKNFISIIGKDKYKIYL